tara:strand:+ start:3876 stop:4655 length:780 start_codon:yes stop_codon:yes gene_type:complete
METLILSNQIVKIHAGELVGYSIDGYEYIHQKGSPGWRNSDTEMFPIIGPVSEVKFQVQTPKDIAVQDQHGLLRELDYKMVSKTDTKAVYEKEYQARTQVVNSKYPDKSPKQYLFWPYDFKFQKKVELLSDRLDITFTVTGERDSPFMLGYHPAFALYTDNPLVVAGDRTITLDEIIKVGNRALEVADCREIVLKDGRELKLSATGFGNFMLWTEVPNMLCIEPITFYPYAVPQRQLHEGFRYLMDDPQEFKLSIQMNP